MGLTNRPAMRVCQASACYSTDPCALDTYTNTYNLTFAAMHNGMLTSTHMAILQDEDSRHSTSLQER
jgi:hypothetical protein